MLGGKKMLGLRICQQTDIQKKYLLQILWHLDNAKGEGGQIWE